MLRTASEMNTETKVAIEEELVKIIEQTAAHKEFKLVINDINFIPAWLYQKLISYGYTIVIDEELNTVEIGWEQLKDAE